MGPFNSFPAEVYVRKYEQSKIGGINFVNAAVVLGAKAFGPLIGPGFLGKTRLVPATWTCRPISRRSASSCAPA